MLTRLQEIICQTQGDIFHCANEMYYDMDIFVPHYMNSDFCKRQMDGIYSYFQMADAEDCLDYIFKEIKVPKLREIKYNPNPMNWIGYTYRQLSFVLGKSSAEIYGCIPFEDMIRSYGLHVVDEDMAAEIIIENKFPEAATWKT